MYDLTLALARGALEVPPQKFVALKDLGDLPEDVRADSEMWCERFFTREADPHLVTAATRAVYLADGPTGDLIRHQYVVNDLRVEIFESRISTLVLPEPAASRFAALPALERKTFAEKAAARLLNMVDADHAWELKLPEQLVDGALCSTDPATDPQALSGWGDRMDGGVLGGRLFFLMFKKVDQIFGFENDQQWFDADFRDRMRKP